MTAKEYLSQAYRIDQRINSKLEQIQSLRTLLTKAGLLHDDMPRNPNRDRSRMEETIVKIIDLEGEIDDEIDRLVSLKAEIMHVIQGVEDTECKELLEDRYLRMMTWDDIADDMCCSSRHVHRIHSRALGMISLKSVTKCH